MRSKTLLTYFILVMITTVSFISLTNAQNKPNVVIMLADNVGYGDIGAYGAGEIRGMPTPRFDQLAGQSLRLTQYLVGAACTKSLEKKKP